MQKLKSKFDTQGAKKLELLIEELTSIGGVSSDESDAAAVIKTKLDGLCDSTEIDRFGNVIGFINSINKKAKTLMLEAHIDRIGLMVTEICDGGFLKFTNIGGVDERILLSAEVCIFGKEKIYGTIFSVERKVDKNPDISHMRIDTGLSESVLKDKVSVGDMIIVESEFVRLYNGQLSAGAMDNRSGAAAILDAISNIDKTKLKYNLQILFSVQEELGLHGAYTGAERLKSDAAVVIDVTHGTTPDAKKETGVFDLGCGAVICRGPNFDYNYTNQTIQTAKEMNLPYEIEVASGPSGTSAWALQISGGGIPSILISIPLKYMHTNVETLDIKDVCVVSALITSIAEGGIEIV